MHSWVSPIAAVGASPMPWSPWSLCHYACRGWCSWSQQGPHPLQHHSETSVRWVGELHSISVRNGLESAQPRLWGQSSFPTKCLDSTHILQNDWTWLDWWQNNIGIHRPPKSHLKPRDTMCSSQGKTSWANIPFHFFAFKRLLLTLSGSHNPGPGIGIMEVCVSGTRLEVGHWCPKRKLIAIDPKSPCSFRIVDG